MCRGDIFELNFPFTPEFNQTITIQPDGYVTLTGVGDLYVAGMTIPELRESLQTVYAKILQEPVINIVVKDFEKPYFIVGGEITRPGKFDMRDDTTAAQAIAIAGGFTGQAKHSQVVLFRHVSDSTVEAKLLNIKAMLAGRDLREDFHLRPGDMVFVPQNMISKIRRYLPISNLGMYWTQRPF